MIPRMREERPVGTSLKARAVLALALMAGFYLLALAFVAGLAALVVMKVPPDDIYLPVHIRIAAVAGIVAIISGIVPRGRSFVEPGPRVSPEQQTLLFDENPDSDAEANTDPAAQTREPLFAWKRLPVVAVAQRRTLEGDAIPVHEGRSWSYEDRLHRFRPIAGSSEGLMLRARSARCWLTLAPVVRGTERAKENAHEARTCRNI